MKLYCVKCRKEQNCSPLKLGKDVRGRSRMTGKCEVCGTKCFRYVKEGMSFEIKSMRSKPRKSRSKSKSGKSKSRSRKSRY